MAKLESQPLSAEERAELEELRAEKARREAQEEARREREELAALRAEREKAEEAMVTSKEPTGENEIPGMAPAQKIIIVLALIAFVIFMGYTILTSMGLL